MQPDKQNPVSKGTGSRLNADPDELSREAIQSDPQPPLDPDDVVHEQGHSTPPNPAHDVDDAIHPPAIDPSDEEEIAGS